MPDDKPLLPDPTGVIPAHEFERGHATIGADGTVIYSAPQLTDVPEGIVRTIDIPPERIRKAIANTKDSTPCGMPISIQWRRGPSAGMPVTLWCAEPLCIDEGHCTGPRFVPHMAQFTHADPDNPFRRIRELDATEIIASVRTAAKLVEPKTHREDDRSDLEIARFVGRVWRDAKDAATAEGGWTEA